MRKGLSESPIHQTYADELPVQTIMVIGTNSNYIVRRTKTVTKAVAAPDSRAGIAIHVFADYSFSFIQTVYSTS